MQTTDVAQSTSQRQESAISRAGLNAANFFQAEAVGVVLPVLNGFLRASGWRYDSIGIATAVAGLGTFLFQTPAGLLTDRINSRRALFGATSLLVGACFVCLPLPALPRVSLRRCWPHWRGLWWDMRGSIKLWATIKTGTMKNHAALVATGLRMDLNKVH